MCQRFGVNGNPLWGSSINGLSFRFEASALSNGAVEIRPFGMGGAIIAGKVRDEFNQLDYIIQRISPAGSLLWGESGVSFATDVSIEADIEFLSQRQDTVIIINWNTGVFPVDYSNMLQMVDSEGTVLFDTGGIPPIPIDDPTIYSIGQVLSDSNSVTVSFGYKPEETYHVYSQKISRTGEYLWSESGILIDSILSPSAATSSIITDNRNGLIYTVEDPPIGGIFAKQISVNGEFGELTPFVAIPGDVNHDDGLDILDIIIIVQIVMDNYLPDIYELMAADVNDDGFIDILDIILIVNNIIAN